MVSRFTPLLKRSRLLILVAVAVGRYPPIFPQVVTVGTSVTMTTEFFAISTRESEPVEDIEKFPEETVPAGISFRRREGEYYPLSLTDRHSTLRAGIQLLKFF